MNVETDVNEIEILKKALKTWGFAAQENMLYEEIGELLTAIARFHRGRCTIEDVVTEIADVMIIVKQMALLYGYDLVIDEKQRKLERLQKRIEADIERRADMVSNHLEK